jgi:hypothetical protein
MATMVSLVSEQTVPNILAIWQFQPEKLLFVSTEQMEQKNKVRDILATVNRRMKKPYKIGDNTELITVLEDSLSQGLRKLEDWIQGKEDEDFIVNLTGGTKLMSIAVFEFFKNYKNEMIYIPIGKNEFISPFPIRSPKPSLPLEGRLTVDEYLSAYGLTNVSPDKVKRNRESAVKRKNNSVWLVEHYAELERLLSHLGQQLRKQRRTNFFPFSTEYPVQNQAEKDFFRRFHFTQKERTYSREMTKQDAGYFTGGWLEDFCYNCTAELLGKGVDDVVLGIQIRNAQNRNNEFDVMFTAQNALYTVECKSLEQRHDEKFDVLYKIGALQKEFGLSAKSYLVATSSQIMDPKTNEIKLDLQARAEQFKTVIVALGDVGSFKKILANRFSAQTV